MTSCRDRHYWIIIKEENEAELFKSVSIHGKWYPDEKTAKDNLTSNDLGVLRITVRPEFAEAVEKKWYEY